MRKSGRMQTVRMVQVRKRAKGEGIKKLQKCRQRNKFGEAPARGTERVRGSGGRTRNDSVRRTPRSVSFSMKLNVVHRGSLTDRDARVFTQSEAAKVRSCHSLLPPSLLATEILIRASPPRSSSTIATPQTNTPRPAPYRVRFSPCRDSQTERKRRRGINSGDGYLGVFGEKRLPRSPTDIRRNRGSIVETLQFVTSAYPSFHEVC